MPEISVRQALRQALEEELAHDEKVFLMGEDIGLYGGCFKVTEGLLEKFGEKRIRDTPLSESVIVGSGVGAALVGYRPVVEIMFADFVTLGMDHIVNNAAKMRYMHDGEVDLPMVIRTPAGGGTNMGPHHSQCVEAWLLNVPGLKIVSPSNAYDAKGLLKSSIRDMDPVVFIEHKILYNEKGEVPENEDYTVPIGKASLARKGRDVTVVSYSNMVNKSLLAAEILEKEGIEAEIVDVRTLRPLDIETIAASVRKTEKAIIAHEAPVFGGAGGEIASAIYREAFDYLDAPIERVGALETPVPFSPPLEKIYLPDENRIAEAVRKLVNVT